MEKYMWNISLRFVLLRQPCRLQQILTSQATRLPLQWYGRGRRDLIALRTAHTTALGHLRSSSSVAASLCRGASAASPASTAHRAVATTITSPLGIRAGVAEWDDPSVWAETSVWAWK